MTKLMFLYFFLFLASMNKADFNEEKTLIRSILLPFQKGCDLFRFCQEYKNINGYNLPFEKHGATSVLEFLKRMPDVVKIKIINKQYHLFGIADENTRHIQKMVLRQKIPKLKDTRYPKSNSLLMKGIIPELPFTDSRYSFRENVPPRLQTVQTIPTYVKKNIIKMVQAYNQGLNLSHFLSAYTEIYKETFSFQYYNFTTLEECLQSLPNISFKTIDNEIIVYIDKLVKSPKYTQPSNTDATAKNSTNICSPSTTCSGKEYPSSLYSYIPHGIESKPYGLSTNKVLTASKESVPTVGVHINQNFSDGFDKISKKLPPSNNTKSLSTEFSSNISQLDNNAKYKYELSDHSHSNAQTLGAVEEVSNLCKPIYSNADIPTYVRDVVKKVLEKHPSGIWSVDFPKYYNEFSKQAFNLHNYGFSDLHSFIDALSDIACRKQIKGNKKDWLIYPATLNNYTQSSNSGNSVLLLELIIENIKKILEAYPEGIIIDDFQHAYCINCNEPLHYVDLGYESVEDLLKNIKESVPLVIEYIKGCKTVFLKTLPTLPPEIEILPHDAAPIDAKFSILPLPEHLDYKQFIPVYTSTIYSPGHFYIQFNTDELSVPWNKLYEEMEVFYNSNESAAYKMKRCHIKVNAVCAAIWPKDQFWYRIKILSIPSADTVQVFYVDYGTKDIIPIELLYYLKNSFLELPVQAKRSKLAYLKPFNGAKCWDKRAREIMLEMCQDVSLMVKIEDENPDGELSVILCDTNNDNDVFFNDVLIEKNMASNIDEVGYGVNPNEERISAPGESSKVCTDSSSFTEQFQNMSLKTSSINNSYLNPNPVFSFTCDPNSYVPTTAIVPPRNEPNLKIPAPFQNKYEGCMASNNFYGMKSTPISSSCSSDDEIFEDDDDDNFEVFSAKFSQPKKRYVKRVETEDGYVFHLILVESQLYISVAEVSLLIWSNSEMFLINSFQQSYEAFPTICLPAEGNKEMFYQIEKCNVPGLKLNEKKSLLLYHLRYVIAILNRFGQPSDILRQTIIQEYKNFNPHDPFWMMFTQVPKIEKPHCDLTDDDKLNRLCFFDLQTMKSSLQLQRANLENSNIAGKHAKMLKLDETLHKVENCQKNVKQVCRKFSSDILSLLSYGR